MWKSKPYQGAERTTDHEHGASTPPEVPEPNDSDQIRVFTIRMPMITSSGTARGAHRSRRSRRRGPGLDEPAHADHETADRRPPHPVEWQPREQVFGQVHQPRRGYGDRGAAQTDDDGQQVNAPRDFGDVRDDGNIGPVPRMKPRTTVATTTAAVTGTRLRAATRTAAAPRPAESMPAER